MAENITLAPVSSFTNDTSAVALTNSNYSIITTAFADCLSRAGTGPNAMGSNLDMNNNQILNLPAPATINSPVRLVDMPITGSITIGSVPPVGTSGAVVGLLNANKTDSGNNTFTGTDIFSGTLDVSGTLTSTQSVSGTGTGNPFTYYNSIILNPFNAFANNNGVGFGVEMDVSGSNAGCTTGLAQFALAGVINLGTQHATTGAGWCGVLGNVVASVSAPSSVGGGIFGVNANVQISANVTGIVQATGVEADVICATGSNPVTKCAYLAVTANPDAVSGSALDAAYLTYSGPGYTGPGWKYGFLIDQAATGAKVLASTGTYIGATGIHFASFGIDTVNIVCSTGELRTRHFLVDGSGNMSVGVNVFQTPVVPFGVFLNANNNVQIIANGANAATLLSCNNAQTPQGLTIAASSVVFSNPLSLPSYVITGSGTISFAGTAALGMKTFVTNAVSSPALSAVVSTTGSTWAPVFYDGTNWRYG